VGALSRNLAMHFYP